MTRLVSCWLLCFPAIIACAQNGTYFLSHHSPSEENFDNVCFDIAQDSKGIMHFAMKAGVMEFDGREWDLTPGAGAVYALDRSESGDMYWAGAKGFGRIGINSRGFKETQYLSESLATNVFEILPIGEQIYFLSENKIYLHHEGKMAAETLITGNAHTIFTGMFELFGTVYVQTERNTIFKLQGDELLYVNLNFSGDVLFQSRLHDTYVFGTSDNRVYFCDKDLVVRQLKMEDQPYADANAIVSGTWVNNNLLALGTLRGGVMLINPATGKRDQIIDYSTGLPDNEVFSLMADASKNIWVAHEYGFTQVSPTLPFRSFSYYDGLEGNMLCVYSHGDNVYVGTSVGLYKLTKEEIYDEVITWIDAPGNASVADRNTNAAHDAAIRGEKEKDVRPSRRRGFFNFLKRNRDKQKDRVDSEEQDSLDASGRKQKKVDLVLRSSQHTFKRVQGIDAKISHLVEVEGRLMAAGLEGVFEVADLTARRIMSSPTRYLYASPALKTVIASTYNDEIWSLQRVDSSWQQVSLINGLGDQIDYVFQGIENEWWLCGLDHIYQLQLNETGIQRLRTIRLSNPNFEKTLGTQIGNEAFFVNTDGFYRFDRIHNRLVRLDSLEKPYQYFAMDGHLLYRDQHRWSMFGDTTSDPNLQLLNLFQKLRFIASDKNGSNLLISGGNELLKFSRENVPVMQSSFPIFLKSIQNNAGRIAHFNSVEIEQVNSAVTFEVVHPDFISPNSTEFRYFLDGMNADWSEWSTANNKINFPYLPPGEYHLRVQARNIFGRVSELGPIAFRVIPPYWKRSWFYALEFVVFASLVMLSFRLSTRYRIISRFLSLITIILLIEFIQTVIGSSIISDDTPVLAFLVQFLVAILILPVEGFLRNLLLRSVDPSGRFYGFMKGDVQHEIRGKSRRKKIKEPL